MEPVNFVNKGEILLGGHHVGTDVASRWDKFEREEKIAPLTNTVDGTGFEMRRSAPEGERIFAGVEVTDTNIPPNWELLVVPPAYYAAFEIDCGADIDRQFDGVDMWLHDNRDRYKRVKWADGGAEYKIIWCGRYEKEKICEVWIPV
ncbi:MAG: hypothetical protein FWF44_06420, partial [Defluviitaleaceae bacterium]|nr:hypothetical protein [Defluviitaleaceae bacterium]